MTAPNLCQMRTTAPGATCSSCAASTESFGSPSGTLYCWKFERQVSEAATCPRHWVLVLDGEP